MSYRQLRKDFGKVFRDLVLQKESEIIEGRLVVDHVLMLISILPKYAVTQVVGYIKGKSAIWVSKVQGTRTETEFGGEDYQFEACLYLMPHSLPDGFCGNSSIDYKSYLCPLWVDKRR